MEQRVGRLLKLVPVRMLASPDLVARVVVAQRNEMVAQRRELGIQLAALGCCGPVRLHTPTRRPQNGTRYLTPGNNPALGHRRQRPEGLLALQL